jgi:uncharacterized membrane protein
MVPMTAASRSRWAIAAALVCSVFGCVALVLIRMRITDSSQFGFLIFNLFLACIPFPLAWAIDSWARAKRPLRVMVPVLAVWLLFFPNAPYLMTDLIHLREARGKYPIYDAILFASFAAIGILLGYTSLYLVQSAVARRFSSRVGWIFAIFAMALGSYGLYLGRIERWNSWDVVAHPRRLFSQVASHLLDPLRDFYAAAFTTLFAVVLFSGYGVLRAFAHLVVADGIERHAQTAGQVFAEPAP